MRDRRIRKSKTALKEALLLIMKKKGFARITVKELCEQADVNRSTFYNNYSDMKQLLSEIHFDVFEEMSHMLGNEWNTYTPGRQKQSLENITEIIRYFKKNKRLFTLFLNNDDNRLFENNMAKYYIKKFEIRDSDILVKYPVLYHMSGSFSLICMWLVEGCTLPEEKLAGMICDMSYNA